LGTKPIGQEIGGATTQDVPVSLTTSGALQVSNSAPESVSSLPPPQALIRTRTLSRAKIRLNDLAEIFIFDTTLE
jgi:hypothetical protein